MRLKSFTMTGYRGISHDTQMQLADFGNRNILIGPNNSGKSIPFRFLHFIAKQLEKFPKDRSQLYQHINIDIDDSFWWQHDTDTPIQATLLFSSLPIMDGTLLNDFVDKDNNWQVEIKLYHDKTINSYLLIVAPLIFQSEKWNSIIQYNMGDQAPQNLNDKGVFISSNTTADCPYLEPACRLVNSWAKSMKFFDPVRATDRREGSRGMNDGATLLSRLHDLQQDRTRAREHHQFIEKLKRTINSLLTPSGVSPINEILAKGQREEPQMTITQAGGMPVSLENMGTGIAELIILLTSLIEDENKTTLYFVEEPETHLHPGLFRRLMSTLDQYGNVQFFVTSHSSVVLDTLSDRDRVYHFYQRNDGACLCHLAKEITQQHKLLDSLGVSASALLQTNCVIWIEGPSDRLYLRHWIKLIHPDLKEGSDYAFVFYGGKILSHFSLEANDAIYDDLLPMINIGRFSAVIMDRDLPPSNNAIRDTKQRICDEAASDADHRRAYITVNREVENDVPQDFLVKAILEIIGDSSLNLDDLDFVQEETYTKEVIAHLHLNDEAREKTIQGKISNKVNLARTVVNILEQENHDEVPAYINDLCNFIISSQNLES